MLHIGMTYDLRDDYLKEGYSLEETAEFDRVATIDGIEDALRSLGYAVDRIGNIRRLVRRLAFGDRWDLVFNIAEGLRGAGREAQVPALLDAYDIPYVFSDPLVLSLTLHKGMTKRVIRDGGLPTPRFVEVSDPWEAEGVALEFPVFAKPISEGTGKGITAASKVLTPEDLGNVCRDLLNRHNQPVLVEEFLPGREFTVGIVGTGKSARSLGAMEVLLLANAEPDVYSYDNKENCEACVRYVLADDAEARAAEEVALASWRLLGCRDGGRVDLRSNKRGRPCFLEVNPLAGLHSEHSDLPILCSLQGIAYQTLIQWIMDSAIVRLSKAQTGAVLAAPPEADLTARPLSLPRTGAFPLGGLE